MPTPRTSSVTSPFSPGMVRGSAGTSGPHSAFTLSPGNFGMSYAWTWWPYGPDYETDACAHTGDPWGGLADFSSLLGIAGPSYLSATWVSDRLFVSAAPATGVVASLDWATTLHTESPGIPAPMSYVVQVAVINDGGQPRAALLANSALFAHLGFTPQDETVVTAGAGTSDVVLTSPGTYPSPQTFDVPSAGAGYRLGMRVLLNTALTTNVGALPGQLMELRDSTVTVTIDGLMVVSLPRTSQVLR